VLPLFYLQLIIPEQGISQDIGKYLPDARRISSVVFVFGSVYNEFTIMKNKSPLNQLALLLLLLLFTIILAVGCSPKTPTSNVVKIEEGDDLNQIIRKSVTVTPSDRQYEWQKNEFEAFIHFGVNTFTGREWGTGKEDPAIFNPEQLDARQWVQVIKDAGMKMVILTAKHHDGFCLWPSRYTEHSVKNSPWKNGQGNVVKELSEACRESGIKLGIYLSPADLHEIERPDGFYGNGSIARTVTVPSAPGHPKDAPETFEYPEITDYDLYFMNQLYELLTEYGEISALWFDGANPKPGTGQTYNRQAWYSMIRKLQPNAVISIKGPDVRWCGNEAGRTRSSEWSVIPLPSAPEEYDWADATVDDLGSRDKLKDARYLIWYPAETNTSMRYGWFYRDEDQGVKTTEHLLDIWYRSIGGNTVFLLNMTPDRRGLIPDKDALILRRLGQTIKDSFEDNLLEGSDISATSTLSNNFVPSGILINDEKKYWIAEETHETADLMFSLDNASEFNRLVLQEPIGTRGQRIESFRFEIKKDGKWIETAIGTTVGYKSILRFPAVSSDQVRVKITRSRISPALSFAGLYLAPEILAEPVIKRDKSGSVHISGASPDTVFHYTLDGSEPGPDSTLYSGPFPLPKGGTVKVRGFVDRHQQSGDIVSRRFDVSSEKWTALDSSPDNSRSPAKNAIDGDPDTFWFSSWKEETENPPSITIDLGEMLTLKGFTYLPRKRPGDAGTVLSYKCEVSANGKKWTTVVKNGTFDNIRNNPVLQEIRFSRTRKTRFLKFTPIEEIGGRKTVAVAELEIIT
jgi:alpha-L-fucosidase